MKVVDVCGFYAPRGGGVRTYIERKLAAAEGLGADVVIVAPGARTCDEVRGPQSRIRWLKSPRFPLDRNYRYFADRALLFAALDAEAPDVVEVSSPWRSAATVAAWPGRALLSLIAHADPLAAYAYRWFGRVAERETIDRRFAWYWRHLLRLDARYDMVVAPGASLAARLSAGGLRNVVVNPLGIEEGVFSPARRDEELRRDLLGRCGLPAHATLLLGVGRHSPEKRWGMVADAAAIAGLQAPVGLVIIGDGHAQAKVRRAAGANPHIHLLAPISDRPTLARLLASGDALIHGCEAETFCFVGAEAAASGLPVIAPDAGGAADHARASGGLVYPAADAAGAAEAILALCRRAAGRRVEMPPARTMTNHFHDLFGEYRRRLTASGARSTAG